ncbi:MAG TPA: CopD family protein [Candidatus Binatia bacterium]|nr:CopD family protein [Candidatus Binatia bacterium]
MLTLGGHAVLVWLHVLGACVWIGGQLVVAAVVPLTLGDSALARAVGRRFQIVAWPAFALLVATGVAQAYSEGITPATLLASAAGRTLGVKLLFVLVSGAAALVHVLTPESRRSPRLAGILGGVSFVSAVVAALYGVVLGGA